MRVAIVTPHPVTSPGGVEKVTLLLTRVLREAGHDVKMFDRTVLQKRYRWLFRDKVLGAYKLGYDLGRAFNRESASFDAVICNGMYGWNVRHPNAINICHGNIGDYADSSKEGMGLVSYYKTRYLDLWFHTKSFRRKTLVVVSKRTGAECERYNKLSDYVVIENSVDVNRFRPRDGGQDQLRKQLDLPSGVFLGLFVGRPEYRKGIDVLEKVAAGLPSNHRIVAAVPVKTILGKNLIPVVNLPHEEIPSLYRGCDYFILPSRHEGCSIALLEALASGLPVLTTKVGNAWDIADADALLGRFIWSCYEPEPYLSAIHTLASDPQLCQELGRRGRDYVLTNCSLEAFRRKYLTLVDQVISGQL